MITSGAKNDPSVSLKRVNDRPFIWKSSQQMVEAGGRSHELSPLWQFTVSGIWLVQSCAVWPKTFKAKRLFIFNQSEFKRDVTTFFLVHTVNFACFIDRIYYCFG